MNVAMMMSSGYCRFQLQGIGHISIDLKITFNSTLFIVEWYEREKYRDRDRGGGRHRDRDRDRRDRHRDRRDDRRGHDSERGSHGQRSDRSDRSDRSVRSNWERTPRADDEPFTPRISRGWFQVLKFVERMEVVTAIPYLTNCGGKLFCL